MTRRKEAFTGLRQCGLAGGLVWLLALSLAPQFGRTAPETPGFNPGKLRDIDAAIEKAIAERRMPGAVFWLEHEGAVYSKAHGRRAIEPQPEPMTLDTIFDLASLTKVVACTPAVMWLVEHGRIDLDAPVSQYIPEFTGGGKERITIRQMLTHTSGLRPDIDTRPPWQGHDTAIRMACREKLLTAPGTAFRYSDINFFMLGEVVERVTGQKLQDFVQQVLYQPLGMPDTGYLPPASRLGRIAPTQRLETGLLRGVVHDPTARYMGGVAGHAGLFSTASDLARYARMLLREGELDGVRIFKPETVRLMTSVQTPPDMDVRRGLGWDIDSGYSRPRGKLFPIGSYGHTGFTGTAIWIDPFSKTFWILLSNRVHPDGKGNVLPLQRTLGTLAAMAIDGFDFANVPGALPERTGRRHPVTRAPTPGTEVLNGIDALVKQNYAPLKDLRIGLITNHSGVDRQRRSTIDLLHQATNVHLQALFSPEHGIRGAVEKPVDDAVDEKTGLPIYSLYGKRRAPTPEQLKGLDALVFDIQDIGTRYYTYISTMGLCMEAAAKAGLKFFVLDRVNPINGLTVEGPVYHGPSHFIAFHSLPVRHGMTVGELARMFKAERGWDLDLHVIPVQGWQRAMWFDQTGLPWINPSPNIRNLTEAILYPGLGLQETALSVGRGTDTPFEVVGAPYIDDVRFAAELNAIGLPGVRFVPVRFTPQASTFAGRACGGVYVMLSDRDRLDAVDVGIAIARVLQKLYPKQYDLDKVQTLLRDSRTLEAIRTGQSLETIKEGWTAGLRAFHRRRAQFLIY